MELDAADTIAEIDQRGSGVLLEYAVGLLGDGNGPDSGGNFFGAVVGGGDIEVLAAAGGLGIVSVPGGLAGGEKLLDIGCDRTAFLLHALDGLGDAGSVPQLERSELPIEPGPHGAIDFNDGVGDLGNTVGGVGPKLGEDGPEEDVGLVLRGRDEHSQALGQVLDILRHFDVDELGFLQRAVFQRLPVNGEALFAVGAVLLLVEAALGFVAEPLAVNHLDEKRGELQIAALVLYVGGRVANDVSEDVEADEVSEAERGHLGPADGGAGQGIDFFDAEVHLLHDAHDVQRGEGTNAIGDKVGRVLRVYHALAEVEIAEVGDGLHRRQVGVGGRDDFEQPHVTRRIEEVRAKPRTAKVVGEAFGDFGDWQAAGVGGNDGSRLADGVDLAQEFALEVEVFDDGLDDPVHFGEFLEVIFKVADGDQTFQRRLHEGGRFRFHRGFFPGGSDAIARGAVGVGGDEVEQVRGNTGVGQVRGDAGSHGARA